MLPHYAPLKVAEVFRTLHAMFPGRIDLGIGRAPGGGQLEAYALLRARAVGIRMVCVIDRRSFLYLLSAAGAAQTALPAQQNAARQMVASVDRERILRNAARWRHVKPETITAFRAERSPGGPHDFYSEADYFWPDPEHPDGPYKTIDGKSNPTNFLDHRKAMIQLSLAVPALTAAYVLTGKLVYAEVARANLVAWFVTPATRMEPSLQYAQAVRNGGPTGRSYGIIDTLQLVEVARAAGFLLGVMPRAETLAVQAWFSAYLHWMQTSVPGIKERDATNNHGVCWALQASEFALLCGDLKTRAEVRERWENVQMPMQMGANGSFPRETARTKPYGYSIFQFDVASTLCWSLGKEPEVRYQLPDGRGMCLAASWIEPYLADKSKWPFPHDVQHWESWPVRSPGLLFCGLSCGREAYIALWKTMEPDPTDAEIVRNYPIRQPLLWVA
jgi:hypothetical protein